MRSFHLTQGSVCLRESGLPKMMSWALLLTPTPALVPAATSTRYCTPACSPPTTTERMVASTDLLTWKRVSLAKHQIWQRRTRRGEFIVRLCSSLLKYSVCVRASGAGGLIPPCTPGWCRSAGRWEAGPTTRWWMCCYGSRPSTPSPAAEARRVLMGQRGGLRDKKKKTQATHETKE